MNDQPKDWKEDLKYLLFKLVQVHKEMNKELNPGQLCHKGPYFT